MRGAKALLMMWALAGAVAVAADVWTTKPFTEWTVKDVDKVMTDSPWAGKASLTHAREGAGLGTVPDWKIIITMRSALPIKQALARRATPDGAAISPAVQTTLDTPEAMYVVAVSGLPRQLVAQLQKAADAAELRRKGKAPLMATKASMQMLDKSGNPVAQVAPAAGGLQFVAVAQRGGGGRGGGGGGFGGGGFGGGAPEDKSGITATLLLGFPKDSAITIEDQEIEFATVIGAFNVKKTFKLKDMMFMGQLAL